MRTFVAAALGAAMLTGVGLSTAQAGVLGPVQGEDAATTAANGDSIAKADYYGWGHGYARRHWGGHRHWGHGRYMGWGRGGHRPCFWRPTPWGPERICRW